MDWFVALYLLLAAYALFRAGVFFADGEAGRAWDNLTLAVLWVALAAGGSS